MNTEPKIEIRGEEIILRPLNWKDNLHIARQLAGSITSMIDKSGAVVLNSEAIGKAIVETEGLVSWLLTKTTGKPSEFVDTLSAREVLPVLTAIVDANFDREISDTARSLGSRLAAVFVPAK